MTQGADHHRRLSALGILGGRQVVDAGRGADEAALFDPERQQGRAAPPGGLSVLPVESFYQVA